MPPCCAIQGLRPCPGTFPSPEPQEAPSAGGSCSQGDHGLLRPNQRGTPLHRRHLLLVKSKPPPSRSLGKGHTGLGHQEVRMRAESWNPSYVTDGGQAKGWTLCPRVQSWDMCGARALERSFKNREGVRESCCWCRLVPWSRTSQEGLFCPQLRCWAAELWEASPPWSRLPRSPSTGGRQVYHPPQENS